MNANVLKQNHFGMEKHVLSAHLVPLINQKKVNAIIAQKVLFKIQFYTNVSQDFENHLLIWIRCIFV
jgi:hypothetical protein